MRRNWHFWIGDFLGSFEIGERTLTESMKVVARNLQRDIDLLVDSLKSLEGAVAQLKERFSNNQPPIHISESLALWAHYRFGGNWDSFVEFADEALRNWPGERGQMWLWVDPNREAPEPEAQRHLHRVSMGLEFIARELNTAVPVDAESHWHARKYAEQLQAYARAANDVLNPTIA
ncbi:MAG TPA: hypothetical protein VHK68_09885 [Gemmatimonadales bacterium]|jgi:hypothetical protein|nr:hypothetical protein [Gemmatimonadales bacterium]